MFSFFFFAVGDNLAKEIICNPREVLVVNDSNYSQVSVFTLQPVTEQDVIRHTNALGGRSPPGFDSISVKILKNNSLVCAKPILSLVNFEYCNR